MRVGALENSGPAPDPIYQHSRPELGAAALIPPARPPSEGPGTTCGRDLVKKFYLLGKEGLGLVGLWVGPEFDRTHGEAERVRVLGRVLT